MITTASTAVPTDSPSSPPLLAVELAAKRAKTGLKVLLAAITSLFFLLMLAYLIRAQYGDWEHLSAPWQPLSQPWQLWVNTAILLFSSVALAVADRIARRADSANWYRNTREALLIGGVLALFFLLGQLWVWQQLWQAGYLASANPANAFFYVFTGLHGLHLTGGLVAWWRAMWRVSKGQHQRQAALSVQLCALYWHYLLVLWVLLLGLLTMSPATFAAFAALCGF